MKTWHELANQQEAKTIMLRKSNKNTFFSYIKVINIKFLKTELYEGLNTHEQEKGV